MKINDEPSLDTVSTDLLAMVNAQHARRNVLKGAVAGLASLSALGTNALVGPGAVFAHGSRTKIQHILDIAVTTEQLAVTTYSNGLANAAALGLTGDNLVYVQAALAEEQIHELFFESLGAKPLTSTFSYPHGATTFTNLPDFIDTQQILEGTLESTLLAGVIEFSSFGRHRLAQILAQIACIEAEHRVLGRVIFGIQPANNWVYAPVLVKKVADIPGVLKTAGYLHPTANNTYSYVQVSTDYPDIEYRTPFTV